VVSCKADFLSVLVEVFSLYRDTHFPYRKGYF
jgi:hypothetical protein